MGYLELADGFTDFSKAVISFWFRVPTETMEALDAISDAAPEGFQSDHMNSICYSPPFTKILPLITFGSVELDTDGNTCQPSFIGIDGFGGQNVLCCNLQTKAAITGIDTTDFTTRPGCFYMSGYNGAVFNTITADVWNHVLVSLDISGTSGVSYSESGFTLTSSNSFGWALNDVSKVDGTMDPSGGGRWASNGLSNPAYIIPQGLIDYAGSVGDVASYSGMNIATNGHVIGIPSHATFVAKIFKVDVARIQFFTDVTCDVTDQDVRRSFITAEGRPAGLALARTLLSAEPVIEFDEGADMIAGVNTGTAGNFTKTGTVQAFTPGPGF